ncbi:unnamed protein product [Blepharisma stoltei]|uniref:Uncharacterized protein n=1 Tax=Blepharisma stoltei TaxID=1481888 RepID=A0AAU9IH20_9CILI|nr:unnamed protein product [Blepharisma stoltei]
MTPLWANKIFYQKIFLYINDNYYNKISSFLCLGCRPNDFTFLIVSISPKNFWPKIFDSETFDRKKQLIFGQMSALSKIFDQMDFEEN